ncbi:mitochondrial import protein Pam17-domain-containing protein [Cercophora scortea]|uniref:Presequence translocated-associated motor subunit PAM17 n=1 Tax=Cercophora scortea TaxID=314031 RepID=A0AAE0J3F2_9PEZI|nr:mitochondrial import protein Pam17-domain-containing protein [Cercophora scortea]
MISSTATTMLRSGVGRTSAGFQPILLRGTAACPYSTGSIAMPFSMAPSKVSQHCTQSPSSTTKPQMICARPISTAAAAPTAKPTPSSLLIRFRAQQQRRSASTLPPRSDHDVDAAAAQAAAAAQTAAHPETPSLDWNTFFKLRKTRRRWQQGFSIVMALTTSATAAVGLSTGLADSLVSQLPLDPFISLGLLTLGGAGLGWLVGPFMGSAVFNVIKRQYKGQMTIKESQFFARIKKHRVDPSTSSMGNPVPDFYGEKISSVAGYRQWLKDQRAFNRKRKTFV